MKLINMTVENFIKEVDSASPAPGGGSVSALASSLGVSLARMVGHLTFGKKKYNEFSDEIKEKFTQSFDKLDTVNQKLVDLIDKDTDNFNLVMAAFKMPKETDEEKAVRSAAIQKATILATETPLKMAELSLEALEVLDDFVEYGNKNAITDVGVAVLLATAGAKGSIYNVKINLSGIENEILVKEIKSQCEHVLAKVVKLSSELEAKIEAKLV